MGSNPQGYCRGIDFMASNTRLGTGDQLLDSSSVGSSSSIWVEGISLTSSRVGRVEEMLRQLQTSLRFRFANIRVLQGIRFCAEDITHIQGLWIDFRYQVRVR